MVMEVEWNHVWIWKSGSVSDIKHFVHISTMAIELCKKYLQNAYCDPGSILDAWVKVIELRPYPWAAYILMGEKNNRKKKTNK